MSAVATAEAPSPADDQPLFDDGLTLEDVVVAAENNGTCLVCDKPTDDGRCPGCGSELS